MTTQLEPLRLEPLPSRRLWGGDRLGRLLDLETASGEDPLGEAWLVGGNNRVATGRHAGRSLQELADGLGERLVGRVAMARYGTKVPLLLKLIDAAKPLSIQVHPDDAYALRHEAATGHLGKEEAWYILDATPGAEIVWGFQRPVDEHDVRTAIAAERLEELVRTVEVEAGDVVYNPAGTVHAIGAGIFLFEVQQASDLTYRLYDYGRKDAQGNTRNLHVDDALAVADLSDQGSAFVPQGATRDGWTEMVRCPYFVLERRELDGGIEAETDGGSLETLTFVSGRGDVCRDGGSKVPVDRASVVLPADLGPYRIEGQGEVLRCSLPQDAK